jgi:hypothetical protein
MYIPQGIIPVQDTTAGSCHFGKKYLKSFVLQTKNPNWQLKVRVKSMSTLAVIMRAKKNLSGHLAPSSEKVVSNSDPYIVNSCQYINKYCTSYQILR